MLTVRWGSATDVGRVRQANEDSLFTSPTLFAVADGMGGHAAGDVASQLAVEGIAGMAELLAPTEPQVEDLVGAVAGINDHILAAGRERPDRAGLGTTLSGIAVTTLAGLPHWAVFNVGDSRVYRYSESTLRQLTVDHSAVQELVDAGEITDEDARYHPLRHVVTRSLGSNPAPEPDIKLYEAVPGERFLVCSDGLTNELRDAEIAEVLGVLTDPQEAAEDLVRRANQAGGRDNSTVIVIDLVEVAEAADEPEKTV
jgi:serine/threonine protein phosphatase PrpC